MNAWRTISFTMGLAKRFASEVLSSATAGCFQKSVWHFQLAKKRLDIWLKCKLPLLRASNTEVMP